MKFYFSAVRELWKYVADINKIYKQKFQEFPTLSSSLPTGVSSNPSVTKIQQFQNLTQTYESDLKKYSQKLIYQLIKESRLFLSSFLQTNLPFSLIELCSLSPTNSMVIDLAVHLIKQQSTSQHQALVDYVSTYGTRKLDEVLGLAYKQFHKSYSFKSVLNDSCSVNDTLFGKMTIDNNDLSNNDTNNMNNVWLQFQPNFLCICFALNRL